MADKVSKGSQGPIKEDATRGNQSPAPATTKPEAAPKSQQSQKSEDAGTTEQSTEKPRAVPTKPRAQTSVTPIVMIRPDVQIFETNIMRTLKDRRRRLLSEGHELAKRASNNALDLQEVEEQIKFLLTPSPIFAPEHAPGLEAFTKPVADINELARTILEQLRETRKALNSSEQLDVVRGLQASVDGFIETARTMTQATTEPPSHKLDDLLTPDGGELGRQGDESGAEGDVGDYVEPLTEEAQRLADEEVFEEDEFVEEGDETEEVPVTDHGWVDCQLAPLAPGLDDLPLDIVNLASVGELTTIVTNRTLSSHIANLCCEMARKNGVSVACIYVRFKQLKSEAANGQSAKFTVSAWYRYATLDAQVWADLVTIVRQKMQGIGTASIGSYVENVLKAAHEAKRVQCQKLTPQGEWVNVPTREERKKMSHPPVDAGRPARESQPAKATPQAPQGRVVNAPAGGKIASLAELVAHKRAQETPRTVVGDELDDVFGD